MENMSGQEIIEMQRKCNNVIMIHQIIFGLAVLQYKALTTLNYVNVHSDDKGIHTESHNNSQILDISYY